MRLAMFAFSLLAALAGTPLRQAEAAADFARSIAELDDGNVVENVDGGVGDDPGDTLETPPTNAPAPLDALAIDGVSGPASTRLAASWRDRADPAEPVPRAFPGSNRRFAWLQRFRF